MKTKSNAQRVQSITHKVFDKNGKSAVTPIVSSSFFADDDVLYAEDDELFVPYSFSLSKRVELSFIVLPKTIVEITFLNR